jgi:biotin carboxyl carrier protein
MNEQYTEFVHDDTKYITQINKKFASRKNFTGFDKGKVTAFIPGTIREIFVKPGQQVKKGETLLVLEAMKMKNNVTTSINGTVKNIYAKTGDMVPKNFLLVEVEF